METNDTLSSCSNLEEQQMQQIQDKAKKSCMVSFRQLHSHLKLLSNNDLQGTRIESGFKRAFVTLFGQDIDTFIGVGKIDCKRLNTGSITVKSGSNRVARVTTFAVACKAYGREASMLLFMAFFTVGLTGDWLTFQKRPGSDIPPLFVLGSMLRAILLSLLMGRMAFHNFMKKPGQTPSFSVRPADQPVDVGSLSVEPLRSIIDNDQAKSLSHSKDKGVFGFKLAIAEEGIPEQGASVAGEGSKKRRSIMESLEEEATVVKVMPKKKKLEVPRRMSVRGSVPSPSATVPKDVEEAHAAHNMISGLHCPLLKDKLGFLSFDELVDVFDIHALQTPVVGNILTNESRILSQGHAKLKNDLVSLKSKKSLLEHEMSKLEDRLEKAQRNHDVEGSQVVRDLRSKNARIHEEVSMLRSMAAFAEESRKRLSEELSGLQPRLKEADRLNQRYMQDYYPEAEKLFDEAAKAFYKLKFPYISLLLGKAGQSLEELSTVEAPSIRETPST
ncbi:hypothetical protein Tco_0899753 [Tanacetum coccineum]